MCTSESHVRNGARMRGRYCAVLYKTKVALNYDMAEHHKHRHVRIPWRLETAELWLLACDQALQLSRGTSGNMEEEDPGPEVPSPGKRTDR